MRYIKTGTCIWCGRKEPEVHFTSIPHILPHSLGGQETVFDVCDECNHYFGTAQQRLPAQDTVFKEIFNITRQISLGLDENTYKKLKSIFFSYRHSDGVFRIKPAFNERIVTRQFKRSLYEVFLQKYHAQTLDGNNAIFAAVRDFARNNNGDLRVFYAYNNVVLAPDFNKDPVLEFSQKVIDDMHKYGAFLFWFFSHPLYLEVFPTVFNARGQEFLQKEAHTILLPAKGDEAIYELNSVLDMDFFMQRFNRTAYR